MHSPLVSVVIPAYNREESIELAITSVLRQSWTDFELIVVDDGSTDGTREVINSIEDSRVQLIETGSNIGASAARNLGVEHAKGQWVAFQDSDDEWLPLKLEKQMERLCAPDADYVAAYCGMLIIGTAQNLHAADSGRLQARYFPGDEEKVLEGELVEALLIKNLISTQVLVARRDLMLDIGCFDPDLKSLIDWDCVIRLAQLGKIAFVDEPLVLQRFSPNSITRDNLGKIASQEYIVKKYGSLLQGYPHVAAGHYYKIAGGYRSVGKYGAATKALSEAISLQPANPKYWLVTAYIQLLRLASKLGLAK